MLKPLHPSLAGLWREIPVAVKTVAFDYSHARRRQRAILETAISTCMTHPNILQAYTYDVHVSSAPAIPPKSSKGGSSSPRKKAREVDTLVVQDSSSRSKAQPSYKIYIVLELCDQGNLTSALRKGRFRTAPGSRHPHMGRIVSVAIQMARGLEHLHKHDVIHGDLKSNNILLKSDPYAPEGVRVKVADFGLSVRLDEGVTHVGDYHAGTPFYAAPEVVEKGTLSKKSDVYSFGVLSKSGGAEGLSLFAIV